MLNVNFHGIRRNVKNKVQNLSDAQIKVREATSNDPWGPSGTLMSEIADLTYNVVAFSEIMQVLWKRLNDHGKNWKHVYKALVLLEYLIKTGSEKVTQQCKENIFAIQTLKDFQYFEEGKDQGVNVREKAKQLVALLKDDERLKNERARALKARERFAQAASHVKQDAVTRQQYGSTDFSQGSFDEDMLSPGAVSLSELEQARPQTAGEEELQLQLALAMSQEEADQAERLKRNDDLRLQMALSESQEEFKKVVVSDPPKTSAMDDLLGISLRAKNETPIPAIDPWGMAAASPSNSSATNRPWNASPVLPETNFNSVQNDPWSPTTVENSQNFNLNYTASLSGELQDDSDFDVPGMKKSFSAEVSGSQQQRSTLTQSSTHLASFLATDSSLINFNSNARTRTLGNPFHATRPSPMTINELRAQNNDNQTFQMSNTMTLPAAPRANPSQNPFL